MPQFLCIDYFTEVKGNDTISHKTAAVNKSLLAVPLHLSKINNLPNLTDILDLFSSEEQEIDDDNHSDASALLSFCSDKAKETLIEEFKSGTILKKVGDDIIEIVPSSNPESTSSSWDIYSNCLLDEYSSKCQEKFSYEKIESSNHLNVPATSNELLQSFYQLPSVSTLQSRLQPMMVTDPLLKNDGTTWREDTTFGDVKRLQRREYDFDNLVSGPKEEFSKASLHEGDLDPIIDFTVPRNETCSSLPEQNHLEKALLALEICEITTGDVIELKEFTEQVMLTVEDTSLLKKLEAHTENKSAFATSGPSITSFSFLNLNNISMEDSVQDGCMTFMENPLFGLQPVNDICEELLENTVYQAVHNQALEQVQVLMAERSLMISDEAQTIENRIWDMVKHFDEVQLPEPYLPSEDRTSPIIDAVKCLQHSLEKYSLDDVEKEQCFFYLSSSEKPLYHVHLLNRSFGDFLGVNLNMFEKEVLNFNDCHFQIKNENESSTKSVFENDASPEIIGLSQCSVSMDYDASLLDSFLHVRSKPKPHKVQNAKGPSKNVGKELEVKDTSEKSSIQNDSEEHTPKNGPKEDVKTIEVTLFGPYLALMNSLCQLAQPCIDKARQHRLLNQQAVFFNLTPDMTRFLLKERQTALGNFQSGNKDEHLYVLKLLHLLVSAGRLITEASLESAIKYVSCHSDEADYSNELRQHLFSWQCEFMESKVVHPKLQCLTGELEKCVSLDTHKKVLIVLFNDLPCVLTTIKRHLSDMPNIHTVVVTGKDFNVEEAEEKKITVVCTIQRLQSFPLDQLDKFSLVVAYEEPADIGLFKDYCHNHQVSYLGLVSKALFTQSIKDGSKQSPNLSKSPFAVVCSCKVTQYKDLLYILEARYNILVVERDYDNISIERDEFYYSDVIISETHCIVLYSLVEMGEDWSLSETMKQLLVLGLQFSFCFVILHGIGVTNKYLIEKTVARNMYKLRASLSCLSKSSNNFITKYKILEAITEEETACAVKNVVDSFTSSTTIKNFQRPWLSPDLIGEEMFLLQFGTISSFSAQLLLSKLTLKEILVKSEEELKEIYPNLTIGTLKLFCYQKSMWNKHHTESSSSSQTPNSVVSERSHGSSISPSESKVPGATDYEVIKRLRTLPSQNKPDRRNVLHQLEESPHAISLDEPVAKKLRIGANVSTVLNKENQGGTDKLNPWQGKSSPSHDDFFGLSKPQQQPLAQIRAAASAKSSEMPSQFQSRLQNLLGEEVPFGSRELLKFDKQSESEKNDMFLFQRRKSTDSQADVNKNSPSVFDTRCSDQFELTLPPHNGTKFSTFQESQTSNGFRDLSSKRSQDLEILHKDDQKPEKSTRPSILDKYKMVTLRNSDSGKGKEEHITLQKPVASVNSSESNNSMQWLHQPTDQRHQPDTDQRINRRDLSIIPKSCNNFIHTSNDLNDTSLEDYYGKENNSFYLYGGEQCKDDFIFSAMRPTHNSFPVQRNFKYDNLCLSPNNVDTAWPHCYDKKASFLEMDGSNCSFLPPFPQGPDFEPTTCDQFRFQNHHSSYEFSHDGLSALSSSNQQAYDKVVVSSLEAFSHMHNHAYDNPGNVSFQDEWNKNATAFGDSHCPLYEDNVKKENFEDSFQRLSKRPVTDWSPTTMRNDIDRMLRMNPGTVLKRSKSHCDSGTSTPQGVEPDTKHFGVYSAKATRYKNIPLIKTEIDSQWPSSSDFTSSRLNSFQSYLFDSLENINTKSLKDNATQKENLINVKLLSNCEAPAGEFSTSRTQNTKEFLSSPSLPVSKQVRKHLKKMESKMYSQSDRLKFLFQNGPNYVRVSRTGLSSSKE